MLGKNNLISDKDRPICSLLGSQGSSRESCNMTRLFKDNFHAENDKFDSGNFISQQKKPGFLRLDSTGETIESREQCGMMPPQNQQRSNPGVQYMTQNMQQQHPARFDRSPTPTRCGNSRYRTGHNSTNNGHRQPRHRGFPPGNSLLSNFSGYNYRNSSPQQQKDLSQRGYPFHQFNNNMMAYPPTLPPAAMMPLGTSRFRAPMYGYASAVPYGSYFPPRHPFLQGPVHPPLFYQAYPFMPLQMADPQFSQSRHYVPQQNGATARHKPRDRSKNKRKAKKQCKNSDVSNLAESLQSKLSIGQQDKSLGLKRTACSSNFAKECPSPCNDDDGAFPVCDQEIRQPSTSFESVPKLCKDHVEISESRDASKSGPGYVGAGFSDEIRLQSGNKQCPDFYNLDIVKSQVTPGQPANIVTSTGPVTHNRDTCTSHASSSIDNVDSSVLIVGENLDSGFDENQTLCNDSLESNSVSDEKVEKIVPSKAPSEHLESELVDSGNVPEKNCSDSNTDANSAASSGAKSDFVIFSGDGEDAFICAYNMEIYGTDDETEKLEDSHNSSDFARFSVHVTELEHFDKDKQHHCHKADAEAGKDGSDESRSSSPPQGQNGASCPLGARQKKKSRPSAKKRKRMKEKKGTINVSICDLSAKSTKKDSNGKSDSNMKTTNSPTRGCFRTVSFIVGSESDSDDFDVEFVQSPRHSKPKSCPKLQFNLLSSDSEDDESGSDSDFESDENDTNWDADVLLDSFCIKDPYSPFSFQLQCTSIPVKKSASSPVLSPTNAFAFDVTIKRSFDPNRRRVSFAVEDLAKIIDEEEAFAQDFQEARKGPWEELARDRHRFERRMADVEANIGYAFQPDHRKRIYDRFYADFVGK